MTHNALVSYYGFSVLLCHCDYIWWYRSRSTLAQVMACCLTAPSLKLEPVMTYYQCSVAFSWERHVFRDNTFRNTTTSARCQWVYNNNKKSWLILIHSRPFITVAIQIWHCIQHSSYGRRTLITVHKGCPITKLRGVYCEYFVVIWWICNYLWVITISIGRTT